MKKIYNIYRGNATRFSYARLFRCYHSGSGRGLRKSSAFGLRSNGRVWNAWNRELKPFTMNHRQGSNSVINLSFLLDAPAGKDGFIRVKGGHLIKPDGKPIHFWGFNLTEWSRGSVEIPSKEDAPMWADTLARFGVNNVRLHFL